MRFDRILEALHEAAFDRRRWSNASALIDEALGTHGNTLACGDGESEEDYRLYFLWTFLRGERHRDLERLYLTTYYPVDEAVPRLRRLPFNELTHITDLYTEAELKSSEAYNALRTLAHAGNAVNVRLEVPNGSRIMWQVNDPVDGGAWTSKQLDTIRRLLPHVRHTVNVQQTLSGAGALGTTLAGLLDSTGLGTLQLDASGRVLAANDCALALLRTGNGLFDEAGFLAARTPRDNEELQRLLGRALPPFGVQVEEASREGGSMLLRRAGPEPPLMLHVNPVAGRERNDPVRPVAALVLIVDPARTTTVDPSVVEATLGLSPMQSQVAVRMAEGVSVPAIAASMGRQVSTVRTHVKAMYAPARTHAAARAGAPGAVSRPVRGHAKLNIEEGSDMLWKHRIVTVLFAALLSASAASVHGAPFERKGLSVPAEREEPFRYPSPAMHGVQIAQARSPQSVEDALGLTRSQRQLAQRGLTALGFDVGAADGIFGRRTRSGTPGPERPREARSPLTLYLLLRPGKKTC